MNYSGKQFHWTIIMVMKPNVKHSGKRLSSDEKKHTKVQRATVLHAQCLCNTAIDEYVIACFEIVTAPLTLKANQINQGRVGTRPSEVLTTRPVEPRFTTSLFFKISKSFSFDVSDTKLKKNGSR